MEVGENLKVDNASWTFSGDVAKNFEDHVQKSVPLYLEGHQLVLEISDFFLHQNSICYEIGCSTGILCSKLAKHNEAKKARIIGIDVEPDMISFAKDKYGSLPNIDFECENIIESTLDSADLIVSYYTIQFISPSVRQILFDKLYQSLNWGGALLLFEKVRAPDARFQDIMTSIYTEYKLSEGYTPSEIVSKSKSLKGVLEPFSTNGNLELLKRAGFKDITTVLKYVCFEGFLAIK